MKPSEWAAFRSALWFLVVIVALVAGWSWWTAEKAPDYRVGRRLRLKPDTATEFVAQVALAGEIRDAWIVPAGRVLRTTLTVPGEEATLRFREGYLRGLPALSVSVVSAGGARTELHRDEATPEAWRLHRLGVPADPGDVVDIEFRVLDGRGRPGLGAVYISDPVLESDGRVVDETEVRIPTRGVTVDLLTDYDDDRRSAPATPESARVDLPGPACVPLPPGQPVIMPLAEAPEGSRLELILFAMPSDEPGDVVVSAGGRIVRTIPLDFATRRRHERLVTLDLPLAGGDATELTLQREGATDAFVGLRELYVTTPSSTFRRRFRPTVSRNILLVVVDSLRRDRLGSFGYTNGSTPVLDGLAARGVRYARVVAPSSWSLPNTASLLTGTSPVTHGLGLAPDRMLSPRLDTLAETAAFAGYCTAVFSSNGWTSPTSGLAAGYQVAELRGVPAPVLVEMAIDWLVEVEDFEWFLTLHFSDPSHPHTPQLEDLLAVSQELDPELVARLRGLDSRPGQAEMMARELGTYYDAELAGVDRAVGLLLDWLRGADLLDDTLIVVVGSEGMEFFERGGRLTGQTLFDEVVVVPALVAGPSVSGPHVEEQAIDLVDLSRLLSAFTGSATENEVSGPAVGSLQGRLPPPFGPGPAQPTASSSLIKPFAPLTRHDSEAVRQGPWLLLTDRLSGRRQLFDLDADPDATDDLLSRPDTTPWAQIVAGLERAYEQWYRTGIQASVARPRRGDLDEQR